MDRRLLAWLLVWFTVAALPRTAFAQSAIAGTVKDTSGAVLPGVTVEASSPVLIEKTRAVVSDGAGQYKIIDLPPGTYTVTFSLSGFGSTKREGVVLETNFTAQVNAELRVGSVEETVIVTGASPIVDVQTTQRREVITQQLLEALPTGRNFQTTGAVLPAVSMNTTTTTFDVGGSTAMQTGGSLQVYGSLSGDSVLQVDGMNVGGMIGTGSCSCIYDNEAQYQEYAIQVSGGTAEAQTGGVIINRVPKAGGNQFHGEGLVLFANTSLQGNNVDAALRGRGLIAAAKLYKLYDVNYSLGGPILKNRLWFFFSGRNWAYNTYVLNAFNPDGSQAVDDNRLQSYPLRLTYQLNQKNKLTAYYDNSPKYRGHRELEFGGVDPKAAVVQAPPLGYVAQVKWTSTVTNRVLIEAGYSTIFYGFKLSYEPEVVRATCFTAFAACTPGTNYGDITNVDLLLGTRHNAALQNFYNPFVSRDVISAISYVTGSHALKVGMTFRNGWNKAFRNVNGDLTQQYRNGVSDSVLIYNTPIFGESDLKADLGIYAQDSWTIRKLTLNPGLRFDYLNGQVPEENSPAGRFVTARHFDAIPNLPNWKDVSPRFGAAYDLFGNGKTAIKGSVGKYVQVTAVNFPDTYNPLILSTDTRTWTDLNGDNIAQENEIGSPTNKSFGIKRNKNPDPSIQRPYQVLYNLGVQQELWPGVGLAVNYYRRSFRRMTYTTNLAVPLTSYDPVTIPDPRGNGQSITVYNLQPSFSGLVNELDTTSANNTQTYNGVDVTFNMRLARGATLLGGSSTGRFRKQLCDVEDPNQQRFCNETQAGSVPFITTLKLSGTYPLPYGVQVSAVFQSARGVEKIVNYLVNRTIVPNLTLAQVTVRLNDPGSQYYDRNNQLDISLAKRFLLKNIKVTPTLDILNSLNSNAVGSEVLTFGSALGRPLSIIPPRLFRVGLKMNF